MPKKTGRPPENDELVIQQMVELRASNPNMSVRAASREAVRRLGLKGQPSSHLERLRKKFTSLEKTGSLPALESNMDRKRREIQAGLAAHEAKKVRLRELLVSKEAEAASLGLETINRKDLSVVLMVLTRERENCEVILHGSADIAIDRILVMGLSAAEADAQILALADKYELLKKQEEVLREIVHLRAALGIGQGVSTQKEEDLG
ncbi:MAG TPA: hypothetical protein VHR45_16655 [Thermoanaerobaculia bacterium]|nr:hypothetical protein [Thermoanaerobaculia bacterium]